MHCHHRIGLEISVKALMLLSQIPPEWARSGCTPFQHFSYIIIALQWHHNACDGISNHPPLDCLLNHLCRRRSKEISKLRVTGLCAGNSPVAPQILETGYSGFGDQYHDCWCPGSFSHQGISRHGIDSIGYATCVVAPSEIWSSSVGQNPRHDTKCEYIFCNLKTIQCVKN